MVAYRKKTYRKKTYRKSSAKAVLSLFKNRGFQNSVKSVLGLNTEKHWLDTVESAVGISNTCGPMTNCLAIPIGDTSVTRTGASVRVTNFTSRVRIFANTAATTTVLVRLLFVRFSNIRGVTGTASHILDSTTRITSQYNMGDAAGAIGYQVLYDKTVEIALSNDTGSTKNLVFSYKPTNLHLTWDSSDTTGAITSLMSDQVRGFIMSSETGANTPNYWSDTRVKFVDN